MKFIKKTLLPVLLAAIWISISEFLRNEFILKSHWTGHYENMGIIFPSEPVNGAVWGIWSFVFAAVIFVISKRFSLVQTSVVAWVAGFVMMWLVIGNLGVLPYGILAYAIPLSMLEVFVASWIVKRLN